MFLAARLNIPLARVECHASMLPEVVDGGVKLIPNPQGEGVITRYVLSDVMRLYRDGGWILLDEVDKVSDELSARLHAITDGKTSHYTRDRRSDLQAPQHQSIWNIKYDWRWHQCSVFVLPSP